MYLIVTVVSDTYSNFQILSGILTHILRFYLIWHNHQVHACSAAPGARDKVQVHVFPAASRACVKVQVNAAQLVPELANMIRVHACPD